MIRKQSVQWILLPNGLTGDGQLSASVFVAPRLRPGGPATLADFDDFADWPAVLAGLELSIELPDGTVEAPASVTVSASSNWWRALFPASTVVRSFHFDDLADRPLISYPVTDVLAHLRNRWAELAYRAREDLPVTNRHASGIGGGPVEPGQDRPATLAEHFTELRAVGRRGIFEGVEDTEELSARLRERLYAAAAEARSLRAAHNRAVQPLIRPFDSGGTPSEALYSLAAFHTRPHHEEPKEFPADQQQARDELAERYDFHHHLSGLGEHPAMLRALGLVIDVVIRPDFVPLTSDADPPVPLRLRVSRPSAFPPRHDDPAAEAWNSDVTPWTWCRFGEVAGQAVFTAVERPGRADFAHGFLHLDPARFTAVAADVDGLALKALNLATTLQRQETSEQRPVEEPVREGVPSIRTGGVALVHTGHANDLHEDFYAAREANDALDADPDNPKDLAASDLVRGYRIDVADRGQWRSLHKRRVAYRSVRDPGQALDVTDEGHVEVSLTSEVDRPQAPADPDRPLYAHEALTTWDGWSLAAARPGHAIEQEPAVPEAASDLPGPQLEITAEAAQGSLPRLRFGASYQLRARIVDLAGNAHTLDTADGLLGVLTGTGDPRYVAATPPDPMGYRRFEPVPPPDLVSRWIFGPGEGVERLAIRSTPGTSAEDYAAASQGATEELLRYNARAERHLLPAKASLQLVETHGLLDEAIDAVRGLDPADAAVAVQQWHAIASREDGSVRTDPEARFVVTGVHQVDGAPGKEQGYVCLDRELVDLPYLPDPLAVGIKVRIRFSVDDPEKVLDLLFPDGGAWYLPQPIRLSLVEGADDIAYDPDVRLLTARVPPGRTAMLRLSSLFDNDPELFGILDWCRQELPPHQAEAVAEAVKQGTHWMTAPWRDLTLVHASQRPLVAPALELDTEQVAGFGADAVLVRAYGETAAQLQGRLFADLPSTAQLDLQAEWRETTDDPAQHYDDPAEMVSVARRHVFTVPVPEPFGSPWHPEIAPFIEPLGGKGATFSTRTREMETPETRRLALLADAGTLGADRTPERRQLEGAAAHLEQLKAHEFGDTRYRQVAYTPVAATRFREYFNPAMPAEDGNAVGQPVTVEVLSSAPPAKPVVLQVVPLIAYAQERVGEVTTSRRQGPGLRVWLGRNWYSSGAGELLAVVCDRGGPVNDSSELAREITLILGDPARESALPLPLRASSFTGADQVVLQARLFGVQTVRDIACFVPRWDAGRQSWFVDLEFDTQDAYFPFVRLGLTRYQPRSMPGLELSPLVSTVFLQTLPERMLTCTRNDGSATVSVSGPAPSAYADLNGAVQAGGNEMVAQIEAQPEAFADPAVGWVGLGQEAVLGREAGGGAIATYTGSVIVPDAPPGQRLRLAVREFELHPADDRTFAPARMVTARRLVHLDTVNL